jgi:myo-inositol catabolism protein IolC
MPEPLCVLAIDQRGWLTDALYGAGPLTGQQLDTVRDLKLAVAEGAAAAQRAGAPGRLGLLVDERFGTEAARCAQAAGLTLAMPIELDRQKVLTPEYDDWTAHLEAFNPDMGKVLIWHNTETDRAVLDAQLRGLAEIAGWLRGRRRPLMVEILAPPTEEQLARCDGDHERFDREILPDLTAAAIDEVLAADVHVDFWKLEGMPDTATFAKIRSHCEKTDPETTCLVLGRNASAQQVAAWLTDAASAGFGGFAVGRTAWWQPVHEWLNGRSSRATAVTRIAESYSHLCEVFTTAARQSP